MVAFSWPGFLTSQLFGRLPVTTKDLQGQTVIVTGANVGLGLETARHLASMNPSRLILAVRDTSKGEAAAKDITRTTGNKNVEVWKLDLSSFSSVKSFADKVNSDLPRLDILIENAGVATDQWRETVDGYETTLQVNVISTTMLALLCLPKLRETVKTFKVEPRIVLVGSEVHFWTPFVENHSQTPIAELNNKEVFKPDDRYQVSKLLDLLITREIGEQLDHSSHPEDKSIKVNCPNPGLCHSELGREAGLQLKVMKLLLARTTEYGARNFVWAALAEQKDNGLYVTDCQFSEPSDLVLSSDGGRGQKNVWKELMDIFAKQAPAAAKVF